MAEKKNFGFFSIGGITLCVQILFLILKLIGVIDWSWLIIFIPAIFLVSLLGVCFVGAFIFVIAKNIILAVKEKSTENK